MNKILILWLVFVMCFSQVQVAIAANSLWNYLSNSYEEKTNYQAPSDKELAAAQNLFITLLSTRVINNSDIEEWKKLGFSLLQISEGDGSFAIVKENTPAGHGFYIVKLFGSNSANILEAPHRPSDLYTHEIVYKMLLEGDFIAAAINTTHRQNVDLAKEVASYYNAFTNAAAKSFDKPKLLQLHAFDTEGHELDADVILSSTKKEQNVIYDQIASCLKVNLVGSKVFKILQYPKYVQELGGTLNINAQKFYQANPNGLFFHIETSKALRDEMRSSSTLRMLFYKCFTG